MKNIFITLTILITLIQFAEAQQTSPMAPGDTIAFWNTIGFEETSTSIIPNQDPGNIWQIGLPQKTNFNAPFSGTNVIVTDTLNPYPDNNSSHFDLILCSGNYGENWYPWSFFIDFLYKVDSDTLEDGGYITVSWDKGLTWQNVSTEPNPFGFTFQFVNTNLYNGTLGNGEQGFSGTSDGWQKCGLGWHAILVKKKIDIPPDTTYLRFNFYSDGNHHDRDGWMIDNIRFFSIELWGGLDENPQNRMLLIQGNPFKLSTLIKLDRTYAKAQLEILNMQGNVLRQYDLSGQDEFRLERDGLPSGMYLVRAKLGSSTVISRRLTIID